MYPKLLSLLPILPLLTPISATLTIAARSMLIEATPLVIAIQDYYNNASSSFAPATFINGLPDLWQNPQIDLDAGAEVHVLHDAPHHPDLRVLTTVAEVFYRIVATRSSNITSDPTSLRGKRIGVRSNSTSEYFAYRYLRDVAGLNPGDYTFVPGSGANSGLCYTLPCANGTLPDLLKKGEIDALTAYEPTTELAIQTIGEDQAVVFRNDSLYRELSVMYTTQAKLDDPVIRPKIIQFLRVLAKVQEVFAKEPKKIWERVANITGSGVSVKTLEEVWGLTRWTGGLPEDTVDLLWEEDKWVALDETLGRGPMTRERIESHVYGGALAEAERLGPL
ncbi:hypothetical protein QBC38DRAFT_121788 [Podospora fimiseda]|uniref:SsuA/THI5-like domain-containing protein n=1 Tax=Podospora fimiseda TaxID=252190 RepID=A0AAN6YM27_9PEZI|nr:hypothetical protein QBC38DRAFT_121788 [Podospora fimiseda]